MVSAVGGPSARYGRGRWRIEWHAAVTSTNDCVMAAARAGEPPGLVVGADRQSAGRGRLGRPWFPPDGRALLVSVLLAVPPAGPQAALQAAAVALRQAVFELSGVTAGLKWPNDLVVGERKLAGLLGEVVGPDRVVVGVGCNLAGSFPAELAERAVALSELGADVTTAALCARWLDRLGWWVEELATPAGAAALAGIVAASSATLGRRVRVDFVGRDSGSGDPTQGGDVLVGRATGLRADGVLEVRDDTGRLHLVTAGDVVHLRPVSGKAALPEEVGGGSVGPSAG